MFAGGMQQDQAKDGVDAFQQLTTKAKIKQPVGKTLCEVDKLCEDFNFKAIPRPCMVCRGIWAEKLLAHPAEAA